METNNLRPTWTNLAEVSRKRERNAQNCFAVAWTLVLFAVVLAVATLVSREVAFAVLFGATIAVAFIIAAFGIFVNSKYQK
jgi:Flp pilus assembly protein TadB